MVWNKGLHAVHSDYFVSKMVLSKNIKKLTSMVVYFGIKDILKSANKLPMNVGIWGAA